MNRREFIQSAAVLGTLAATVDEGAATTGPSGLKDLIDVNVNLGRWPLRRLRGDDADELAQMLRKRYVTQAWAGSFEGLLHKDLAGVNERLAEECRRFGRRLFVPFGSVNPKASDWEEELRRCAEEHRMPGIRLHPNYHGYKLDDPDFERLLRSAAERGLIVQIAVVMEDERMMHPLVRVEPVDTAPLAGLIKAIPGLRLVLLNALGKVRGKPLVELVNAGKLYVEVAMLEGVGGVGTVLKDVPQERVLFGSHAPLFYFEAAALKLKESPLSREALGAICRENAKQVLAKSR